MDLRSILVDWRNRTPVDILPELRTKMLTEIKERYLSDLNPEMWRMYLGDDPDCEFPTACYEIIGDVIDNNMNVNHHVKEQIREELFEESQTFLYEISPEVKEKIDFVDKLVKDSILEIEVDFPGCKDVFGESATQLLVDLAFQYRVYSYTRSAKSDMADYKRMINICGQIVEDIFCTIILLKPNNIGELERELREYTVSGGEMRESFFKKIPYGKRLINPHFLNRLRRVARLRNEYSHGTDIPVNPEEDFRECIGALFEKKYGILDILYDCLNVSREPVIRP